MPLRILFIIFAFLLFSNLIILILSFLTNQNLYKTKGKLIFNFYAVLAIVIVVIYFILPVFVNV